MIRNETIATKFFTKAYAQAHHIRFNPEWNNGAGYFDHICSEDLGLSYGEVVSSICPDSNRRLIIVGTRLGNAVFFDRYTPSETTQPIVVCNAPSGLRPMLSTGPVSPDVFEVLFGKHENIGFRLESLYKALTK